MAKHLGRKDIESIVNLIRGWKGYKLTWPEIVEKSEPLIGKRASRQSLCAHEEIAEAYRSKKALIRGKGPAKPMPSSLKAAAARIANLESQVAELKELHRRDNEQFDRWLYNTYKGREKVGRELLNRPISAIDRERSDGETR